MRYLITIMSLVLGGAACVSYVPLAAGPQEGNSASWPNSPTYDVMSWLAAHQATVALHNVSTSLAHANEKKGACHPPAPPLAAPIVTAVSWFAGHGVTPANAPDSRARARENCRAFVRKKGGILTTIRDAKEYDRVWCYWKWNDAGLNRPTAERFITFCTPSACSRTRPE